MSKNNGSEVITLQFGNYSNFIGTHWWNIQESGFDYSHEVASDINHDVLFREGENHRNEITFTPRLLLVDLKGSLGHLRNDLYDDIIEDEDLWNTNLNWPSDKVEVVKSATSSSNERNDFQEDIRRLENDGVGDIDTKNYNLDDNIKFWSDYLRTKYHPKSVNLVNEYQHGYTGQPFDCFMQGIEVWKNEAMCEEWTDKVRSYVEECDCLQGFQIVSDATNGFGGLCSGSLQYIKDEYSTKTCLVFPVIPPRLVNSNFRLRNVNSALLIASLIELSDMFSPLSLSPNCWSEIETYKHFPYLNYKEFLPYHTSSLHASLLDTISLSYRLRGSAGLRMNDLCSQLTPLGRKAVSSSFKIPWPMKYGQSLLDCLEQWDGPLSDSITPYSTIAGNVWLQIVNMRGIDKQKLLPKDMISRDRSSNPAYNCSSVGDMMQYYLSCESPRTVHHVHSSPQPMKTSNPYPDIFTKQLSANGWLQEGCLDEPKQRVNSIPMFGSLHCCQSSGTMLSSLHEQVKIKVQSIPSLLSLDRTEWSEILESIISLSDDYNETDCI